MAWRSRGFMPSASILAWPRIAAKTGEAESACTTRRGAEKTDETSRRRGRPQWKAARARRVRGATRRRPRGGSERQPTKRTEASVGSAGGRERGYRAGGPCGAPRKNCIHACRKKWVETWIRKARENKNNLN